MLSAGSQTFAPELDARKALNWESVNLLSLCDFHCSGDFLLVSIRSPTSHLQTSTLMLNISRAISHGSHGCIPFFREYYYIYLESAVVHGVHSPYSSAFRLCRRTRRASISIDSCLKKRPCCAHLTLYKLARLHTQLFLLALQSLRCSLGLRFRGQ